MDARAGPHRRPGELAGVGERLQCAGPPVDEGAEVTVAPDQPGGRGAVDIGDVRAAAAPLLGARAGARRRGLGRNALDPGGVPRLGPEPQTPDEVEDEIRRRAGEAPQALALL